LVKTAKAASSLDSADLLFLELRTWPRTSPLRMATPPRRPRVATVEALRVVAVAVAVVRTIVASTADKAAMAKVATTADFMMRLDLVLVCVPEEN